jgi:hypothetical protein
MKMTLQRLISYKLTSFDEVLFGRLAPVHGGPGFVVRRLEEVACMTTSKGHCRLDQGHQAKSHSFFFCKGLDGGTWPQDSSILKNIIVLL